jgi:hypothetical protein
MSRDTAEWYRTFGQVEARGNSAIYEEWAAGVAADPQFIGLLNYLPLQKRQPNLIFACSRLLGAPEGPYGPYREWMLKNSVAVAREALQRSTQTNEARRCATLLPALGLIPGPIALLEVGASAGLCLYPDLYSYRYTGHAQLDPAGGPSAAVLESTISGPVPVPTALPEIVWRAGLDLAPLNVRDPADMFWLETLLWPEQHERRERLRAAIGIASKHPPLLVAGDAVDNLVALANQAPDAATLVIVSSAVLVYLPAERRARFAQVVRDLGARWVSLEGAGGLERVEAALPTTVPQGRFVLALDEHPLAYTGAHGQSLDWL